MARVAINTGATPNDGTGDNLRAAGGIINNNFLELYTYLGAGSTDTLSAPVWNTTASGINTLRNVGLGTTNPRFTLEVGSVGASGTSLWVNGDARITGILTIGTSSITLNGSSNTINVGSGITINGNTGIISATSIVVGGTALTGAAVTSITAGSGISIDQSTGNVTITATGGGGSSSQWVTTAAGIHTLSNVGIGTTNPTSALTVSGLTSTSQLYVTGISTFGKLTSYSGANATYLEFKDGVRTSSIDFVQDTIQVNLPGSYGGNVNSNFYIAGSGFQASYSGFTTTTNLFANNLSVSGVSTISTLNVGTGGTVITTTGIGSVGIGTINPTSLFTVGAVGASGTTLTVNGDARIGGISGIGIDIRSGNTSTLIGPNVAGNANPRPVNSVAIGADALFEGDTVQSCVVIGYAAGYYNTGDYNTFIGDFSGYYVTSGNNNTILGTYNGNENGLDIRTSSNNVVLSDGSGNIRLYANSSGLVGIGTTNPQGTLQVGTGITMYGSTGIISATKFYGDGSGLSNVAATNSRVVLSESTGSIGVGTTVNLNISGFKTYSLLKVGISSAAWVVLYTDATSRTNDQNRLDTEDPAPGSGVIAEVLTTSSGISTFLMTPAIIGWNNDVSVGSTIYARVTNNESSSADITVDLTVVKLED